MCRCRVCTSVWFWTTSLSALSRSMSILAFASSLGEVSRLREIRGRTGASLESPEWAGSTWVSQG